MCVCVYYSWGLQSFAGSHTTVYNTPSSESDIHPHFAPTDKNVYEEDEPLIAKVTLPAKHSGFHPL